MARIGSSVTLGSWIPLNAMQGIQKLAADLAGLPVERSTRSSGGCAAWRGSASRAAKGRGTPPGRRTATLRAVTACRVAVVPEGLLDREALAELASQRRRASRDV